MESAFGVEHGDIAKSMTAARGADFGRAALSTARKGKKLRAMETESLARQLKAGGKSDKNLSPARPGVLSSRARKQAWERGWS
jgi:hypothetical protein